MEVGRGRSDGRCCTARGEEGLSFLLDCFLFGIIMACSVGNKVVKAVKTCGMGEVVFVKRLVPFK